MEDFKREKHEKSKVATLGLRGSIERFSWVGKHL